MDKKISNATMSRYPVYLKALRKMQHEGKENCLSSELSELTGILDTTIRRDFTYLSKTNNFGQRGKGYDVKHLIDVLSEVLGLGLDESIILIGVGNLGSAETDKRKTLLFLTEKAHALKDEYDSVSDKMGSIY